jgi:excisionase family DNA binding protein
LPKSTKAINLAEPIKSMETTKATDSAKPAKTINSTKPAESTEAAEERLLKPAEVASLLHVSPSTLRTWIRAGKLRCVKTLGGHYRIPQGEVERLKREMGVVPSSQTLTVREVVESLNLRWVGDRAVYGGLLEALLEGGIREFSPEFLSSQTGYPLDTCMQFCTLLASKKYLELTPEGQNAISRGVPEKATYRLTREISR